jgi:hypothetical protein
MSDVYPANTSQPPEYEELPDDLPNQTVLKHMMTGDRCADKAIAGGLSPEPPSTEYDY